MVQSVNSLPSSSIYPTDETKNEVVSNQPPLNRIEKAKIISKKAVSYTGIAALITAITSAVFLVSSDQETPRKLGKGMAYVYASLEIALLASIAVYLGIKIFPFFKKF